MTPHAGLPTLVAPMMTEAQIQYLEEVLGVNPASFQGRVVAPVRSALVLTGPTTPPEQELLGKILGSIQLKDFQHIQIDNPNEMPADQDATHVLVFHDTCRRETRGERVWWHLPALKEMLGANAEVVARKKEAWALLQILKQEMEQ